MSAKREMQVVNNMPPEEFDESLFFGMEISAEDRAKFFYLAVEETPGAPMQVSFYGKLGYEPVKVVCQHPVITVMRIPREKRREIQKMAEQRAIEQGKAAQMEAKNLVSGGDPHAQAIGDVKQIDTGKVLTMPAG